MTKKIIFIAAAILFGNIAVSAQDKKVAVFDPAGNVESSVKEIVREEISSVIVNSEGFTVLERQLINKVLEENKFQQGGLVDDEQISEIGKRMGANYVFVTSITPLGTNYYISCKMIEVMTARIEKQKTAQTTRGANDLIAVAQRLVGEMFIAKNNEQSAKTDILAKPQTLGVALIADGKNVFQQGKLLTVQEVRNLMANNDALRIYEKGLSQRKTGNTLLTSGIVCLVLGTGAIVVGQIGIDNSEFTPEYISDDYFRYLNLFNSGCIIDGVGVVLGVSGIIVKSAGNKTIRSSVNAYNRSSQTSYIEYKFGFTGNGVGLVINF